MDHVARPKRVDHRVMSRLEARLALEAAIEIRFPRLIAKKPTVGSVPLDLYAVHQSVLRLGGYRKVESGNLWDKLLEELGNGNGSAATGLFQIADTSHAKYQIRERGLRHMAWIEDEAPPARVAALTSAARITGGPLTLEAPAVAAIPSLIGGTLEDIHPWLQDFWHYDAFADEPASLADGGVAALPATSAAEAAASEGHAASAEAGDQSTAAAGDGEEPMRELDAGSSADSSAPAAAGTKRGRGDAGATAGGRKAARVEPRVLSQAALPAYMRVLPMPTAWETDGDRLYKLHDFAAQSAGAQACHMPTNELTDDEAAAFPAYSRAAHMNTIYTDAQRRDQIRAGQLVYLLPNGVEADIDPADDEARELGLRLLCAPSTSSHASDADTARRRRSRCKRSLAAFSMPAEEEPQVAVISQALLSTPVGGRPSVPPVSRYHVNRDAYCNVIFPTGMEAAAAMAPDAKRRFARSEPLAAKLLERVPEQEPWVGGSASRIQFYLDVRNHILLKWVQSQNPDHPRNSILCGAGRGAALDGARGSSPSHPDWNGSARYSGPGELYVDVSSYAHPAPLTLAEVTASLPVRYHEFVAAVFDFLEARGKINIGAIALPSGLPPPAASESALAVRRRAPLHADRKKRIVVLGAGISGLAAARQLLFFGHDVTVIEARGRPGGRICTNRDRVGMAVDEGAMISTGDEPNPFGMLARQLNIRLHRISNTQVPLLLPRRYHRRVTALALAREKRAAAIELWAAKQRAHLTAFLQQRKMASSKAAAAAADSEPSTTAGGSLYNPAGRTAFGVFVPPELSHLPNEVIKHAVRISTGHAALLHTHLEFLRRVYKCLTVAAMSQVHDPHAHATYGVLHPTGPLPAKAETELRRVFEEMAHVSTWLASSIGEHAVELLRHVMRKRFGAEGTTPNEAVPPTPLTLRASPSADGIEADPSHTPSGMKSEELSRSGMVMLTAGAATPAANGDAVEATDDDDDAPFVVAVPANLDTEFDVAFNAVLEETNKLRAASAPPAELFHVKADRLEGILRVHAPGSSGESEVFGDVAPLLSSTADPASELLAHTAVHDAKDSHAREICRAGRHPCHPLPDIPLPPGWTLLGNEMVKVTTVVPGAGADGVSAFMTGTRFAFRTGTDGGVVGEGINSWSTDVSFRDSLSRYVDPRRTDYELSNAYEVAYTDPALAPAMAAALATLEATGDDDSAAKRARPRGHGRGRPSNSPRAPASSAGAAAAARAGGSKETAIMIPAKSLFFGVRPKWDMSLGHAFEYVHSIEEHKALAKGNDADLHDAAVEAAEAAVVAAGGLPVARAGAASRDPRDSSSVTAAIASALSCGVPPLAPFDRLVPTTGSLTQNTVEPPASQLSYGMLRRSVMRWHSANLEYGCARNIGNVSLHCWDQDDIHSHHDRGYHAFAKDGYDCFVRGMVKDIPVLYDHEVTKVDWRRSSSAPSRVRVHALRAAAVSSDAAPGEVQLDADAAVVTASVGVLQADTIKFSPQLPEWKANAVHAVGMGLLNKVIIRFPYAFWRQGAAAAAATGAQTSPQASTPASSARGAATSPMDMPTASLLASFGWATAAQSKPETPAGGSATADAAAAVVNGGYSSTALTRKERPPLQLVPAQLPPSSFTSTSVFAPLAAPLPATFASHAAAVNMLNLVANAAQTVAGLKSAEAAKRATLERALEALRAAAAYDAEPSDATLHAASAAVERARVTAIEPEFPTFSFSATGARKMPMPINTYVPDGWLQLLRYNGYRDFSASAPRTGIAVPYKSLAAHRVASFIPFMETLSGVHFQLHQLTDAQIMSACALAVAGAALERHHSNGASAQAISPVLFNVTSATDIFTALTAIGEVGGDLGKAAALIVEWMEEAAHVQAQLKKAPSPEVAFFSELAYRTPASVLDLYRWAADYSQSVFQVPDVTPPPPAAQAGALSVTGSTPAPTVQPATPRRPDGTIAPAGGSRPVPASPAPSAGVPPVSVAAITVPRERLTVKMQSLQPHDDAFCRVVVGDGPDAVRRRGEAYMFWCYDGPSRNAGLRLQPGEAGAAASAFGALPGDDSGEPVLIAMMAGDAAEWVESASDEDVLQSVKAALGSLFGAKNVPAPTAHLVTRWRSDRFARGSYSFLPPTSHGIHYDLMACPVDNTLFFAGEATNRHHPTTAAGAFDSGIREATRLASTFGRSRDSDVERILNRRRERLGPAAK